MKKSELKFKCVVENQEKAEAIIEKLGEDIELFKWEHHYFLKHNSRGLNTTNSVESFRQWPEPLMTYEEALELIESIEPESDGEWVEFDVDKAGLVFGQCPRGINFKLNWQSIERLREFIGGIFGGWHFEGYCAEWSMDKVGVSVIDGKIICDADNWKCPAIPTRIRFWRVKGGK